MKSKNKLTKIIIISCIIVLLILGIIIYKKLNVKEDIYIEIASKNVSYTYGPNNNTIVKVKNNDTFNINILSNKKNKVKCYSKDENILTINKTSVIPKNNGTTEIYCKLGKSISNSITINVGGNLWKRQKNL